MNWHILFFFLHMDIKAKKRENPAIPELSLRDEILYENGIKKNQTKKYIQLEANWSTSGNKANWKYSNSNRKPEEELVVSQLRTQK
ncbi:hypothetical protein KM043_007182 [Ampulex compressa]|nr:hypothetical protein KM043_007182 [Ampulex compressa]